MRKIFRQGDVLILQLSSHDKRTQGELIPRDRGRIVLAYGEVTGHAHAIVSKSAKLYAFAEEDKTATGDTVWLQADRLLRVTSKKGVSLSHEEHGTISLPVGDYVIRIQREYGPEEFRNVQD